MNIERRVTSHKVEVRTRGDKRTINGLASVFNSLSEDLGGFREIIAPGAFDSVLTDPDTRGLFNHDSSMVLGRNGTTMRLFIDAAGLGYEIDPPDTTFARDLLVSMERGDINQSSFQFMIADGGDRWEKDSDGVIIRTITKIGRLLDVSPVTFPAYPAANSSVRGMEFAQRRLQEFLGTPIQPDAAQRVAELEQTVAERDAQIKRMNEQIAFLSKF
jgi:HK97 family phage prohead protease